MLFKNLTLANLLFFLSQNAFAECDDPCCKAEPIRNGAMNAISFAPLFVFLFIVILILYLLKREGYKIGDALKENETINISEDNPALEKPAEIQRAADGLQNVQQGVNMQQNNNPPVAPFVERTVQPKSSSRLLAFISGIITVGLASCLCSFWIYRYFQCDKSIDLSSLSNVLLALGLGVVPYAVNKVSSAFRGNKR